MPHTLTDTPAFAPVATPVDGDSRNAASVEIPFQTLANRTAYLNQTLATPNGSTEFVVPLSTGVGANIAFFQGAWSTTNLAIDFAVINWSLQPPKRGKITHVKLKVLPAATHSGIPASLPRLTLAKYTPANVRTVVATLLTPTPGSTGAYENEYELALAPTEAIDPTLEYVVEFSSEHGANSVNGLLAYNLRVTYADP